MSVIPTTMKSCQSISLILTFTFNLALAVPSQAGYQKLVEVSAEEYPGKTCQFGVLFDSRQNINGAYYLDESEREKDFTTDDLSGFTSMAYTTVLKFIKIPIVKIRAEVEDSNPKAAIFTIRYMHDHTQDPTEWLDRKVRVSFETGASRFLAYDLDQKIYISAAYLPTNLDEDGKKLGIKEIQMH